MNTAISRLTCGFCGSVSPQFHFATDAWAAHYRAVYCIGLGTELPRLSGLGRYDHNREDNWVPAEAHQQYDQDGALEQIRVRGIRPPDLELPIEELRGYAWGFVFHDACWSILEQAVLPSDDGSGNGSVDIRALWRILLSVPCGLDLPNWGHNYGGLYLGTVKDQARGEHFVLLGPNSNLVIPSASANPFRIPELEKLVENLRVLDNANQKDAHDESEDGNDADKNRHIVNDSLHVAMAGENHSGMEEKPPGEMPRHGQNPLADLPLELKEFLLCYLDSASVANLRLASRDIATIQLSQQFFRSRFWPGREMEPFFDGFLQKNAARGMVNWTKLYWHLKTRLRHNLVGLGERNRLRIWNQTIKPLAGAIQQVSGLGELKGAVQISGADDWGRDAAIEVERTEPRWKTVETLRPHLPETLEGVKKVLYGAEIKVPKRTKGVCVALVRFFGLTYITGLRFIARDTDELFDIGYTGSCKWENLLSMPLAGGILDGFHVAVDECGIRALALVLEQQSMVSEHPEWAGELGTLKPVTVKLGRKGSGVESVRATFDGFRMRSLVIVNDEGT